MKTTISLVAALLFVLQLNAQTAHTYSATNIAQTTAIIRGNVDAGTGNFFGVEFEIADNSSFVGSTFHGPIEGTNFYGTSSNISFNLTGLNPNATYFYRVKVGYSTTTGSNIIATTQNFTTLGASVPTVDIGTDFSGITDQAATNSSNQVVSDGGSNVTSCGIVIANHTNPSSADREIPITSGITTFNANINGLTQLTKYYVKSYAYNSTGYGYSSISKSFSTRATINASIDSMVSHNSGELTIYFKAGSGDACILYIKEGSTILNNPINGSSYIGSTSFGSGYDIGDGTFVICSTLNSKANNSVTITNLSDEKNYYIKAGAYDYTSKTYDISGTELSTKDNSNLPIELISFSAKKSDNGIKLKWVTATELSNDFFTIERSINNSNYSVIDIIDGAGNSNHLLEYEYNDISCDKETSYYYRLKQTDFDGKYTYSKIIYVASDKENLSVINLTNSNNTIDINIANPINKGVAQLIGIDGKVYVTMELPIGDNIQISFNKGGLTHGIYLIKLYNNYSEITMKMIL